jgi:MscS family membrane protein
VLNGLKQLLLAHTRVTPDPARVRFVGLGAHSLDIEVYAYVDTRDWDDFLAVREDLLLRTIEIVAKSGAGFAFPSQTLYVARDAEPDAAGRQAAEVTVSRWRERSELPLPEFPAERAAKLRGTLAYPAPGAARVGSNGGQTRP